MGGLYCGGMVMMAVGLKLDIEYYSTLLFAIGFSFMTNGLVRVVGNWYHMRPENREEYQEKLRRQQINLKDERKMQLRWRAGYIAWSVTVILCFVGAFVMSLFQLLTFLFRHRYLTFLWTFRMKEILLICLLLMTSALLSI